MHSGSREWLLSAGSVSQLSNATGHAVWEELTVASATASWTFIHFVCDGMLASWHLQRPNSRATGLPMPPVASQPLWLRPRVATVVVESSAGGR